MPVLGILAQDRVANIRMNVSKAIQACYTIVIQSTNSNPGVNNQDIIVSNSYNVYLHLYCLFRTTSSDCFSNLAQTQTWMFHIMQTRLFKQPRRHNEHDDKKQSRRCNTIKNPQ